MQALWSRAGQAHLCGCKACFKATNGFVRQSTTRTTRRKPTFGEIFTACYTSILGSAAVIDATRKDVRSKELDRQLEQVKEELVNLAVNAPIRTDYPPGSIHNRYPGCLDFHEKQPIEVSDLFNAITRKDIIAWPKRRSSSVRSLWRLYGLSPTPATIRASDKTDYAHLMECLQIEEQEANLSHRDPKTNQQLENTGFMIAELVVRLMRQFGTPSTGPISPLQGQIQQLQQDNYPHYEHILLEDDSTRLANRRLLNTSFWKIIQSKSNPRDMVDKLCHNLLISKFPPNITTYNMMIAGFNKLGQHNLAQAVVDSFLHFSKLEPTQQTLVCILNHYKEQGDVAGFYDTIKRMTAKNRHGIGLRRKLLTDVRRTKTLRNWARTKDVAIYDNSVHERAWFDVDVSRAIIQGLLSFGRLEHAAMVFGMCLERGFFLGFKVIVQLFDRCIYEMSQPAAVKIILALTKDPELLKRRFLQVPDLRRQICERIQRLLDVCGLRLPADLVSSLGLTSEISDTLQIAAPKLGSRRLSLQFVNLLHQIEVVDKGWAGFEKAISNITCRAIRTNGNFSVFAAREFHREVEEYLILRYQALRQPEQSELKESQEARKARETQLVFDREQVDVDTPPSALRNTHQPRKQEVKEPAISILLPRPAAMVHSSAAIVQYNGLGVPENWPRQHGLGRYDGVFGEKVTEVRDVVRR